MLSVATLPIALALVSWRRLRPRAGQPAVLFGTTPIINLKYWSRALRSRGYVAESLVYDVFRINEPADFDWLPERIFPRLSRFPGFYPCRRYLCFGWSLLRYDVLVFDFNGGCLRDTPLARLELPLRRLGGQHVVLTAYGSDAIDIRRCPDAATREAMMADYPELVSRARLVRRRVDHLVRWASLVVCAGPMIDYLPRYDVLVTSTLAIDIDEWSPREAAVGRRERVRILHAPNHRNLKGTQALIDTCEQLATEGVPVELVLLEGVPNREIRRAMFDSDIVASGFVLGYYELFAVEGMSLGKPVLNYWRPDLLELYTRSSYAGECPIVDASVESLAERIRELVGDPELRERIGAEGRAYVLQHHSYEAVGGLFAQIVDAAWTGARDQEWVGSSLARAGSDAGRRRTA